MKYTPFKFGTLKNKTFPVSIVLILLVIIVNIFNIGFNGLLFAMLSLDLKQIILNAEYWRLLSYPFVFNTWESGILFSIVFSISLPNLENFLGRSLYVILLLFSILFALLLTIIFISNPIIFGGLEGISFFILTLSWLLKFRNKLFTNKPIYFFTEVLSLFVWLCFKSFVLITSGVMTVLPSIVISILGIGSAFLVYLQINHIIKKNVRKSKEIQAKKNKIQADSILEEISIAMYANEKFRSLISSNEILPKETQNTISLNDDFHNEEILNNILDKINIHGKDSLTKEEVLFLEEYSKSL